MAKIKVVVTRQLIEEAQALLAARQDELEIVQWHSEKPCDRAWLLDNVRHATGLLVMLSDRIDEEVLEACGAQLQAIASCSVGTDHVDHAALQKRHVRLGYTPSCLTDAVADLALMLVLMAQRRGGEAMECVKRGDWPSMPWHPLLLTGPQIRGCTVGFLGFGRIGQATLKRLVAFDIQRALYLTSKPGRRVQHDYFGVLAAEEDKTKMKKTVGVAIAPAQSLEQIARQSDVVVVACALTRETRHLVDASFLAKMKKTAVLVNVGRGAVVDSDALAAALESGALFGAGLDVVENEPLVEASHVLLRQPRCVVVPHIGSATVETRRMMAVESVGNLLSGVEGGEMVNEVVL